MKFGEVLASLRASIEKRRARDRAYYEANAETIRARHRVWSVINAEKESARNKAYRAANREKVLAREKAYNDANPDLVRAQQSLWSKSNPEKVRAKASRKRAAKNGCEVTLTNEEWKQILESQSGICFYCEMAAPLEQEHVVPLIPRKGEIKGHHTAGNVVGACVPCNRGVGGKHNEDPLTWFFRERWQGSEAWPVSYLDAA